MQSNHFSQEKTLTVTVTLPTQIQIAPTREVASAPSTTTSTTGDKTNALVQVQIVKSRPPFCISQDKDKERGFIDVFAQDEQCGNEQKESRHKGWNLEDFTADENQDI